VGSVVATAILLKVVDEEDDVDDPDAEEIDAELVGLASSARLLSRLRSSFSVDRTQAFGCAGKLGGGEGSTRSTLFSGKWVSKGNAAPGSTISSSIYTLAEASGRQHDRTTRTTKNENCHDGC